MPNMADLFKFHRYHDSGIFNNELFNIIRIIMLNIVEI